MAKSGLAAGIAWSVAVATTDVPSPVLASLTAIVVVQVSVRASVRTAVQRSAAVVLGVFVALAVGDALRLNGLTVAVLVVVSLGVAELVLRLPRSAARQVPVSVLVVLSTVAASPQSPAWQRALDTVLGAAVGVVVSLALPASRLVDARQSLDRLSANLADVLDTMGRGLHEPWSAEQTADWRRTARTIRERRVAQAEEAVGNGRDAARWNVRDRRHIDELGRLEDVMPRLLRAAIGVSVISRGLDDHARLTGTSHPAMSAMGELLIRLGRAIRVVVHRVLADADHAHDSGDTDASDVEQALADVDTQRDRCMQGATRRARVALDEGAISRREVEGEWLGYAALLVQVDRIAADLRAPLPF